MTFTLQARMAAEFVGTAFLLAAAVVGSGIMVERLANGNVSLRCLVPSWGGVMCAHLMFGLGLFSASRHVRSGASQVFSEFIATFGLMSVIWGCSRSRSSVVPFAVAAYITAAYWFTASTSFANPAVALARAATDTFSGICAVDVPGFVGAQLLGAGASTHSSGGCCRHCYGCPR